MKMLNDFAVNHLLAAVYFARSSRRLEEAGNLEAFGQNQAYVAGAIMAAVAFLETTINGILAEAVYGRRLILARVDAETAAMIRELAPSIERLGVLEKYQLCIVSCRQERLNEGIQPYQRAALLIELRNTLVHFHPEWVSIRTPNSDKDRLTKLGHKLRAEFDPTRLLPAAAGNPYFPDFSLGYGCAAWAVRGALDFADAFAARLSVRLNHHRILEINPDFYDLTHD
jgi:hypothetical protein